MHLVAQHLDTIGAPAQRESFRAKLYLHLDVDARPLSLWSGFLYPTRKLGQRPEEPDPGALVTGPALCGGGGPSGHASSSRVSFALIRVDQATSRLSRTASADRELNSPFSTRSANS